MTQLGAAHLAAAYFGVGLVAGAVLAVRPLDWPLGRAAGAGVAVVLWPFVLPFAVRATAVRGGAHAALLDALGGRVAAALASLGTGEWQGEKARVDALVRRLREVDVRVAELDAALTACPAPARERLSQLRADSAREVERGVALLEDLAAQLLVLRFSPAGTPEAGQSERARVEELLACVEALAAAKREV